MSDTIDRRVVEMRFDNKEFDANVQSTMTVLEKLREKLSFKNAGKDFDDSGLPSAVDRVRDKFSALEVMGVTALVNITNSAVNLGKRLAKSFTVDQVRAGFAEYELKMGSIQTIMASTGADIDTVNKKLNELNAYSDRTIYSFSDMTQNIGKFTNAGVGLDDAVLAIQGVSNVAALAGANTNEASRAMYNFSQALSSGSVKLIDWKSIENANMATVDFKQSLLDTAVAMGTVKKTEDGYVTTTKDANGKVSEVFTTTKGFNDSLSHQWMTTEVLTQTLANYSIDLEHMTEAEREAWREELRSLGYKDAQIAKIEETNRKAYAAAQDVKTFSQLIDTVKESIGSGWAQTFEYLFGNLEEAKRLWTAVNNVISDFVSKSANARNELLKGWHDDARGRLALIDGFGNLYEAAVSVIKPIHEAFRNVFPPTTVMQLVKFSVAFDKLTRSMILSEKTQKKIKRVFTVLFSVLKVGTTIVSSIAKIFLNFIKILLPLGGTALNILDGTSKILLKMADASGKLSDSLKELASGVIVKAITGLGKLFGMIGKVISKIDITKIGGVLAGGGILALALKIGKAVGVFTKKVEEAKNTPKLMDLVSGAFEQLGSTLNQFQASIKINSLLKIAIAVGILAASCSVLASVPPKKLAAAGGAIGGLMGSLVAASKFMTGAKTKGVISMALAIVILAKAVKTLSEVENIKQGLGAVTALLAELGVFCYAFDKFKIKPRALKKTATGLILMAVAINLLVKPVKELGAIKTESLIKGLSAIAGMMIGFVAVSYAFSKIKNVGSIVKAGAAMILMAAAIRMLVKPVKELGAMDADQLIQGLEAVGAALGGIIVFSIAMGVISKNVGGILKAGVALLLMATGIKIMASAINSLGRNKKSTKGLIIMAKGLGILAVAMLVMKRAVAGAAAMLIVAAALMMLAPSIAMLSALDLKGVGVGLLALAGVLGIFAVAAAIVGPIVPIMLALGVAVGLLGAGILALSVGLAALGTGLSIGLNTIIDITKALAEALPIIAEGLAEAFLTFLEVILESTDQVVSLVLKFGKILIDAFVELTPKLVDAGMNLLIALLTGIRDNMYRVTQLGIDIVVNFIESLAAGIPKMVNAAYDLALSFVTSFTDALDERAPELAAAVKDLFLAALQAMASGIPLVGGLASELIGKYRENLSSKKSLDAVGKDAKKVSDKTNSNLKVPNQFTNGKNAIQGLINAFKNKELLDKLRGAANVIADIADKAIKKKNEIKSPSRLMYRNGRYIMEGLINGVDSLTKDYSNRANSISSVMIASANDSMDALTESMNRSLSPSFNLSKSNAFVDGIEVKAKGTIQMQQQEAMIKRFEEATQAFTTALNEQDKNPTFNLNVPLSIDGRAFARAQGSYLQDELDRGEMLANRKLGLI